MKKYWLEYDTIAAHMCVHYLSPFEFLKALEKVIDDEYTILHSIYFYTTGK